MTQADPSQIAQIPLHAEQVPPAAIEVLKNAIIAPVAANDMFPCGVFRNDDSFCDHSRTFLSRDRFSEIPELPTSSSCSQLKGRFLFSGLGRNHFGHFLLESITRLWALDHTDQQVDGLLFVDREDSNFDAYLARNYLPFFSALTPDIPIYITTDPVRINELIVPTQGIGHRNWSTGTPEFRHFIRSGLERAFVPEGPENLYISRSKLKTPDKHVHQEDRIEALMEQSGYTIFHPEQHSIDVQCQRYLAARSIVGADGSAFHLAAFLLQPETRVAIFQRRKRPDAFQAITNQLEAFSDVALTAINPLAHRGKLGGDGVTPINFRKLAGDLKKAGFL